jgi:hypothetical protein
MTEPRTEAGRKFIELFAHRSPGNAYRVWVSMIEAEAGKLDVERLAAAFHETDCSSVEHDRAVRNGWMTPCRIRANTLVAEYERLSDD